MEGMFEIPPSSHSEQSWHVDFELPSEWSVGLIVGPSGSGKSTIAREIWGDNMVSGFDWPQGESVLDAFPKTMGIKDITALLSSVGFSSPPSWLRPFGVLSNGEQFRANMARAIAENKDIIVVDEFTSVVDRTVAKIGSAAIAKTVRRRKQKFIAGSCHYDICEWLEPDWVYQPHTNNLQTGRLLQRRPKIRVDVCRVGSPAWGMFRKFHYLTASLNRSAACYVGGIDGQPAIFCAILPFPHATRPGWRVHRIVCSPDFQGVGLGSAMANYISSIYRATGKPVFITSSHPAVIRAYNKSPLWAMRRPPSMTAKRGRTSSLRRGIERTLATARITAGFEYVGPAMPTDQAEKFIGRSIS
jgi:GNAT superfamily N-acetyltransferase